MQLLLRAPYPSVIAVPVHIPVVIVAVDLQCSAQYLRQEEQFVFLYCKRRAPWIFINALLALKAWLLDTHLLWHFEELLLRFDVVRNERR